MAEQTMLIGLGTGFAALLVALGALLRGWRDWLELKRAELELRMQPAGASPSPAARIELAGLRERVRRLEAIADGVG